VTPSDDGGGARIVEFYRRDGDRLGRDWPGRGRASGGWSKTAGTEGAAPPL
jgi:hypothetical protein